MSLFVLPWLLGDQIQIRTLEASREETRTQVLTSFFKVCEALSWYLIPTEINNI